MELNPWCFSVRLTHDLNVPSRYGMQNGRSFRVRRILSTTDNGTKPYGVLVLDDTGGYFKLTAPDFTLLQIVGHGCPYKQY